jgi:hypothetical protein
VVLAYGFGLGYGFSLWLWLEVFVSAWGVAGSPYDTCIVTVLQVQSIQETPPAQCNQRIKQYTSQQ